MNTPLIKKLIIAVIIIAIGVVIFIYFKKTMPSNNSIETSTSTNQTSTTTLSSTESNAQSTPKPQTQSPKPTITRDQAYKTYSQKGLYIQLIDCVGYPSSLIMKQGTNFMLENKSDLLSSVVIKSQTVLLPAKSFTIVSAKDLGFYKVLCNGKNALQLQVSP